MKRPMHPVVKILLGILLLALGTLCCAILFSGFANRKAIVNEINGAYNTEVAQYYSPTPEIIVHFYTPVPSVTPAPTATLAPTATPIPATATATKGPTIKPEDKFLSESEVPGCLPINGPWLEAFGKEISYEIKRDSQIFRADDFVYFEGVVVGSSPKDLHQTFELTTTVTAEQGNIWACGLRSKMSPEARHTVLFQSTDKKWQNWDDQLKKPFHPMKVVTEFGNWSYKAGVKPAWALDNEVAKCPFTTKPELNNPAGAIVQADGSFVGAPGKAGCDFLAQFPDNTAKRYKGAKDSFPYPSGTKFWIFDPKFSNADLAKFLNLAEKAITEGK